MPNRNRAVYLPEAIESILEQTLEDIELIVVDDDSSDDSRDIVDTFANRDRRVIRRYLGKIEDIPTPERIDRARNIGNKLARADYICVTDSDDWYLPRRAKLTYERLRKEKEPTLFYGAYLQRDRFGKIDKRLPHSIPAQRFSKRLLKRTGFFRIGHFTVGYKKETILRFPYNSFSGVGDWGMFCNLLIKAKCKSIYTKEPLSVYRMFGNSANQWGNEEFHKYLLEKKKKKMEFLGELRDI